MLADGISPDHYTIGSLMEAYSRAGKPWKTLEVFDTLFALHQVQPNLSAWNSLLGAFAHADHKVAHTFYRVPDLISSHVDAQDICVLYTLAYTHFPIMHYPHALFFYGIQF